MIGRVLAIVALAVLAGLALALRDLVLPPPRQVPLPLESLVVVSWVFALAALGWLAAQLFGGPLRLLVAGASAVVAIGLALAAKQVRYPDSSLVGDGFEILIWIYVALGLVGAAVGSLPALRASPVERAAGLAAVLVVVAGALGAVPYVLAR